MTANIPWFDPQSARCPQLFAGKGGLFWLSCDAAYVPQVLPELRVHDRQLQLELRVLRKEPEGRQRLPLQV